MTDYVHLDPADLPRACERCSKRFVEGEPVVFDSEMFVVHRRCAKGGVANEWLTAGDDR